MTAHEDWVTSRTKAWLDSEYKEFIDAKISEYKAENAKARADGYDNPDVTDEDVEELSGELENLATRKLADGTEGIVRDFVMDCLSETDWSDLAADYLYEGK